MRRSRAIPTTGSPGKHGMTVSELKALNPDQGDMIHIGDELVVQRPQTFLQVQVTRVVEYEKTLDYQTKKCGFLSV